MLGRAVRAGSGRGCAADSHFQSPLLLRSSQTFLWPFWFHSASGIGIRGLDKLDKTGHEARLFCLLVGLKQRFRLLMTCSRTTLRFLSSSLNILVYIYIYIYV